MLDRDLAKIYQIETRTLNQVVKRNIEKSEKRVLYDIKDILFQVDGRV